MKRIFPVEIRWKETRFPFLIKSEVFSKKKYCFQKIPSLLIWVFAFRLNPSIGYAPDFSRLQVIGKSIFFEWIFFFLIRA